MYERSCADFGGLVEEGSVADAPPSVEIYTLLAGAIDAASATDLHSFATRRVGVAQHLSPRSGRPLRTASGLEHARGEEADEAPLVRLLQLELKRRLREAARKRRIRWCQQISATTSGGSMPAATSIASQRGPPACCRLRATRAEAAVWVALKAEEWMAAAGGRRRRLRWWRWRRWRRHGRR